MLLRHRPPRIDDTRPATTRKGFEHLDQGSVAVLQWLRANRVDFVLVGAVAEAVRGSTDSSGPVSIVPAPYGRNFERLSRALSAADARLRIAGDEEGETETMQIKLTPEKLGRGQLWTIRCGSHDVDIEGRASGSPSYQELLYEAARFQLAGDLSVEVASPEHIEHYSHVRRTGLTPEIRITRNA
jgi:hypothetical protein